MPAQSLRDLVRFVRVNSPFYAKAYAGLPGDVGEVEDLPVIAHSEFWAANTVRDNQLLTGPLGDAVVFKTGGTTGSPKFSCYTRDEWREFTTTFASGMVTAGLRAGHKVVNLFYVGELYASFLFLHDCLQHAPVENVRLPLAGTTPHDVAAGTVADFDAEVIAGVPTTLFRLAREIAATGRPLPSVRLILFGGEALYDDQLDTLDAAFPNAIARSIGCASVDAGLIGAAAPGEDTRIHIPFTPQTIVEILDETDTPIKRPGRPGRLVVTNLTRRLMPILRYPVGDQAEWVGAGRFRLLGRTDEGVRLGPVSVYSDDLYEIVKTVHPEVEAMQLLVRHWAGRDGLILRLAVPSPPPADVTEALLKSLYAQRPMLAEHVESGVVHPVRIDWPGLSELAVNPRTGKLVRVLDERHRP